MLWLCDEHGERLLNESGQTVSIWRRSPGCDLGTVTPLRWSANRTQRVGKIRRRRERLQASETIFGRESVWWRTTLFDFIHRVDLGLEIATDELEEAAIAGFLAHQAFLRPLEGQRLAPADRFFISFTLAVVSAAMAYRPTKTQAKQLQLELASGHPLTTCSGSVRWLPKHRVETLVPGCGLVFLDTRRPSGGRRSYWLRWCPEHEARKHPERTLLPEHLR